MPNPKDTLSLVERLTAARKGARIEEDARTIADAQDVIERLTSQGGVPEGWRAALAQCIEAMEKIRSCSIAGCDEGYGRPELWADALYKSHWDVSQAINRARAMLSAAPSPPVRGEMVQATVGEGADVGTVTVPGCQWHDISTAPKDGSKILAWDGDYVIVKANPDGGWSDDFQQYLRLDKWMPLPAPPINAVPKPEGE